MGFVLVSSIAYAAAKPVHPCQELRMAFFSYSHSQPLNPVLTPFGNPNADRTQYHLTYQSGHEQTVTAILTIPNRFKPPYPAVLLLAGAGGSKTSDYIMASAEMLARVGYASLAIDAQYHGERARPGRTTDLHKIGSVSVRNAWIQTVIDLRRGVDYLDSRRDINPKRIGFLGFSEGAIMGAILGGVEPRLHCYCLVVPGADFLPWAKKLGLITPQNRHNVEVTAKILDPIHFVGRIAPRPLLILSGRQDPIIPRFATEALYDHAKQPKKLIWYNSGHIVPLIAINTIRSFFVSNLGKRAPIHPIPAGE